MYGKNITDRVYLRVRSTSKSYLNKKYQEVPDGKVVKTMVSQGHEMYCSWSGDYGFETYCRVKLGMHST